MAECSPRKLLLPFVAYSFPLGSQQQIMHQRLPRPHTRAWMEVLLHIASANFCALTTQLAVHITPSLENELRIPSQLGLCKSIGSAASWNGPQVDCKVFGLGQNAD
eukprot:1161125-Pelagomonas_calceolata.AAC.14